MYYINRRNELNDVVDSMPYNSTWASGLQGCEELGDAGASVGVGVTPGGLKVNTGVNVSFTWLLIGGVVGYFVFFHKKGRG